MTDHLIGRLEYAKDRPERLSITSPDGRNLGRWGIGETRDEIAVKLAASGYTLHPDDTITGPAQ